MSDNGGGRRGPLSGGKRALKEGGIRVPFIVRDPGVKAGSWRHAPIVGYDLFPTYPEWAGVQEIPDPLEGGSIASLLGGDGGEHRLIKFHETGGIALYDLAVDIAERDDLHGDMPDVVTELERQLDDYLAGVDAAMPMINDRYDPERATATRRDGRRRRR